MRIGMNALFLQQPTTGSGQHLFHLIRGLHDCDQENSYTLLSPKFRRAYPISYPRFSESDRFRNVEVWSAVVRFNEHLEKLWWEQVGLVQACAKEGVDLLHIPYFAAPLVSPVPTVVTIHDVIPLILKEYAWRRQSKAYTWLVSESAKHARAVIAVSECSKRDIVRTLGIPADRIHVIGNAVDEELKPVTDSWALSKVRDRYSIGDRYILYFGGFDLRKNVLRLIRSYAALPERLRSEYQLVIAGRIHQLGHPLYPDPRPLVRELGLEDQVIFTGQFREEDKARLLSGSTAFIFPSLYEGFGIPALEAMKCGAPLITSNTSSLPEVVGDGGYLIDPTSESSITDAIGCLLDSPDRRAELSERAQERAGHFSWRQVAEQTLEVYRRARAA